MGGARRFVRQWDPPVRYCGSGLGTCHCTRVQTHSMRAAESKPQRKLDSGKDVCPCRSIDPNTRPSPVGGRGGSRGGGRASVRTGVCGKSLDLPLRFVMNL